MPEFKNTFVIDHPLVQNQLTLLRDKRTPTGRFRAALCQLSMLLGYELTRNLPTTKVQVETPLGTLESPTLAGPEVALVSILRAGNGMIDGLLKVLPDALVGHVGLYRDHQTHEPIEYYFKVPPDIHQRHVILVDPMLATGHSACAAVEKLKSLHPLSLKLACVLAAPEGILEFQKHHFEVPIYTAAIDLCLNEHKYIVPGLGDAGDRQFGT